MLTARTSLTEIKSLLAALKWPHTTLKRHFIRIKRHFTELKRHFAERGRMERINTF
jgi:hypothetical protein